MVLAEINKLCISTLSDFITIGAPLVIFLLFSTHYERAILLFSPLLNDLEGSRNVVIINPNENT